MRQSRFLCVMMAAGVAAAAASAFAEEAGHPTAAGAVSPAVAARSAPHVRLSSEALAAIRPLAVQHNGRRKPFESFARETLQSIAGVDRLDGEDPVITVLSILAYPEPWQSVPLLDVPFRPLREQLGMHVRTPRVSYAELVSTRKLMRLLPAIVQKQQRDEKLSMFEQETMDAYERFVTLSRLFEHDLALVPPPASSPSAGGMAPWLPIFEPEGYPPARQAALRAAWTGFLEAARTSADQTTGAAQTLASTMRAANPVVYPPAWRLQLEVAYHHAAPFHVARLLYLLAFLALVAHLAGNRRAAWQAGMGFVSAAWLVHIGGIATRVIVGGRPPVSNFFETMLWLPFVGVTLALVFERVYRVGYFGLSAAALSGIMLTLADYVPLDSSVAPVVAVLRSNLWLTIHVLTIVASYGALALSAVLAHVYGALYLGRRPIGRRHSLASEEGAGSVAGRPAAVLERLELFVYRAMQVGVVLLAAGIMLGAVWANASWGRYWGWDPKETWALITLLWFLALLHGRFAGWLHGVGVALATIGGFFLLLMTYYGVSFYLVGLHSYAGGHAKPLPVLLIAYVIAELLFMAAVGAAWRRQSR